MTFPSRFLPGTIGELLGLFAKFLKLDDWVLNVNLSTLRTSLLSYKKTV